LKQAWSKQAQQAHLAVCIADDNLFLLKEEIVYQDFFLREDIV
jgi:hypothetical protein